MAKLAVGRYSTFVLILIVCFYVQAHARSSFSAPSPRLSVQQQQVKVIRTSANLYSLSPSEVSMSCNPDVPEVQLDFHSSFSHTDFVASLFIVVKGDGTVHAVNYLEWGNEIFRVYEGKLSAEETATLFTQANSPQVRKALTEDAVYPTTPGDFDFYELGVQSEGVLHSRQFQTSNRLPRTVSTLVTGLLNLRKGLTRVEPPFWYLRSGNVMSVRRAGLETRFNVRFASLMDSPENVRSFVETALKCPGHFIPLSEEEHSAMLKGFNQYVTQGEKSFELMFFDGWRIPQPKPEPQRTTVKPSQ